MTPESRQGRHPPHPHVHPQVSQNMANLGHQAPGTRRIQIGLRPSPTRFDKPVPLFPVAGEQPTLGNWPNAVMYFLILGGIKKVLAM